MALLTGMSRACFWTLFQNCQRLDIDKDCQSTSFKSTFPLKHHCGLKWNLVYGTITEHNPEKNFQSYQHWFFKQCPKRKFPFTVLFEKVQTILFVCPNITLRTQSRGSINSKNSSWDDADASLLIALGVVPLLETQSGAALYWSVISGSQWRVELLAIPYLCSS